MTRLPHHPTRRRVLLAGGGLFAWAHAPRAASAAGQRHEDKRLLVVVLRGGMDGLAIIPVPGDPAFEALRATTPQLQRDLQEGTLPLQGIFALNGHLTRLDALFRAGEAVVLHAAASPSRDRSHFAAQDLLESGLPALAGTPRSGWLNRALQALPAGERLRPGFAVAPTVPLIMRGAAPVDSWQPQAFQAADDDTLGRLLNLYAARDPVLAQALRRGAETDQLLGTAADRGGTLANRPALAETVNAVVRLMARPDGPRIASMSLEGWDTHADQGYGRGRIGQQLHDLNAVIGALRDGLEPVWRQTVVAVVTEFGRTARLNGSGGTDHGTATVALLLGGAVRGGRVIADWPGLAPERLFEGRDLAPTTDLRAVFKGVLAEHLGIPRRTLDRSIFPESAAVPPMAGLLRG